MWRALADSQVLLKYPTVFGIGFAVTFLLTPPVRRLAMRMGMMDMPDARRIHPAPTPRAGGLAVFLGFHAACAALYLVPWRPFSGLLDVSWWIRFLPQSALLAGLGLLDDRRPLRPAVKLAGQAAVALLAFSSGQRFAGLLGHDLPVVADMVLTVAWLLAMINAFNLIDGMDGLAAGLGLIASVGMATALLFRHLPGDALTLLGLAGACGAFLRFNFHPASVFLGDTGSMFLGFALGTVALGTSSKGAALASVGVPLLAAGVPVFDVMLAVWRRSVRGLLPASARPGNGAGMMEADLDHLHHRLLATGQSPRRVAAWLYALNAVLAAVGLLSLVFREAAVGIFLLAFVAGSYVLVAHLARVELWDSGMGILSGLARPSRKVLAVLAYPLLDVALLALALAAAVGVTVHGAPSGWAEQWSLLLPVWTGVPFLALFLAKTYRRVWSRSRVTDFVFLGWMLLLGIVAALGVHAVLSGACPARCVLTAVAYAAFSLPLLLGLRGLPVFLQDALALMGHGRQHAPRPALLVYGAGLRCTQFLQSRRHGSASGLPHMQIAGVMDEDTNLHGRFVYSYPVLGGIEDLGRVIVERRIQEIVVTAALPPPRLDRLLQIARREHIAVREWRGECVTLLDRPAAGDPRP